MEQKNAFFDIYKKEEIKTKQAEENDFRYTFDILKKKKEIEPEDEAKYNHKFKRERLWYHHKKDLPLPTEVNEVPVTSAQDYGWRKPIDTFDFGYK